MGFDQKEKVDIAPDKLPLQLSSQQRSHPNRVVHFTSYLKMQINVPTFGCIIQTRAKKAHQRQLTEALHNGLVDDGLRWWRESLVWESDQNG